MKKFIRIIALIVFCITLSSMLTSCNMLDEMREHRVNILEESNGTIWEYQGTKYKLIDVDSKYNVNYCNDCNLIYVREDVPLLLTNYYGSICYYCSDHDLLITNSYNADKRNFYCTLDKYEEYCSALMGELTNYKYECRESIDGRGEVVSHMVDDELTAIINDAVKGGATSYVSRGDIYEIWMFIRLDRCDAKDMVEQKEALTIYMDQNGHFGVVINEERTNDGLINMSLAPFPEKYEQKVSQFFNDYRNSSASYDYTY